MYIEKVATFGIGYLVYKQLMAELAKEPEKEGVKLTSEGLLGFKGVTPEELEVAIFGNGLSARPRGWTGMFKGDLGPSGPVLGKPEAWSIMYGSLLPEGFELTGPSRTGITRPKGLD